MPKVVAPRVKFALGLTVLGAVGVFGGLALPSLLRPHQNTYWTAPLSEEQANEDRKLYAVQDRFVQVTSKAETTWEGIFKNQVGREYGAVVPHCRIVDRPHKELDGKGDYVGTVYSKSNHWWSFDGVLFDEFLKKYPDDAGHILTYMAAHAMAHDVQRNLYPSTERWYQQDDRLKGPDHLLFELQDEYLTGICLKHWEGFPSDEETVKRLLTELSEVVKTRLHGRDADRFTDCSFLYGTVDQRVEWILKGAQSGRIHKFDNMFGGGRLTH